MSACPFYLVWSPDGPTPPRKRWALHGEAIAEAERMAARFPGREFYVVDPSYRVVVGLVERESYWVDDGVPF